ncbi:MAG: oligosaccharide repeat unit polymerase [Bacteroidaceae bacterium]|nr:oligosaccharide repeat unit polymerase [Bacteroidaceae bacterium]
MSTLIISCLSAIAYIILFRVIYADYLVKLFEYIGFKNIVDTSYEVPLTDFLAFIPIIFFQAKKVPSDFIAILTYLVIHIPTVITLQYQFKEYDDIIVYQLAFTFSQILFFLASWHPISKKRCETNTNIIPIRVFFVAGIVILVTLIAFFGTQLRFVSFTDIYSLRSENDKFAQGASFIPYFCMWTADFFAPLFIAYGCYKKQYIYTALGFFAALIVYMATGSKSAILLPFVTVGIYYLMRLKRMTNIKYFLPVFVVIILIFYAIYAATDNKILYLAATVLFMRTLGVAGWLATGYITVFNSYPFTFYSHIGIVNFFTGMYPFHNPSLGNAVWTIYRGWGVNTNANANFLLTDGYAAMGTAGVIIISIVFFFVLIYTNKLSNNHDMSFVLAMLTGAILAFTNISLFTAFVSCGFLFCLILLRYTDTKNTDKEETQESVADES